MYCYVWSYEVRSERIEEFREAYGDGGEWVRLFRRDPEYLRTILLQDRVGQGRFMTLDFWTSREACRAFRERFAEEFEALDRACERLTVAEVQVGEFDAAESVAGGPRLHHGRSNTP